MFSWIARPCSRWFGRNLLRPALHPLNPTITYLQLGCKSSAYGDLVPKDLTSKEAQFPRRNPQPPPLQAGPAAPTRVYFHRLNTLVKNNVPEKILREALDLDTPDQKLLLLKIVLTDVCLGNEAKWNIASTVLLDLREHGSDGARITMEDLCRLITRYNLDHIYTDKQPKFSKLVAEVCMEYAVQSPTLINLNATLRWLTAMGSDLPRSLCEPLHQFLGVVSQHAGKLNQRSCFSWLSLLGTLFSMEDTSLTCTNLEMDWVPAIYSRLCQVLPKEPLQGSRAFTSLVEGVRMIAELRLYDAELLSILLKFTQDSLQDGHGSKLASVTPLLYVFSAFWYPATDLFKAMHCRIENYRSTFSHPLGLGKLVQLNWSFLAQGMAPPPYTMAHMLAQLEAVLAAFHLHGSYLLELQQLIPYIPDDVPWKSACEAKVKEKTLSYCKLNSNDMLTSLRTDRVLRICGILATANPAILSNVYTCHGLVLLAGLIKDDNTVAIWPAGVNFLTIDKAALQALPGRPVAVVGPLLVNWLEWNTEYVLGPFWRQILLLEANGWDVKILPSAETAFSGAINERMLFSLLFGKPTVELVTPKPSANGDLSRNGR